MYELRLMVQTREKLSGRAAELKQVPVYSPDRVVALYKSLKPVSIAVCGGHIGPAEVGVDLADECVSTEDTSAYHATYLSGLEGVLVNVRLLEELLERQRDGEELEQACDSEQESGGALQRQRVHTSVLCISFLTAGKAAPARL